MSFIIGEVVAPIVGDPTPFEQAIGKSLTMGGKFVSEIGGTFQSIGNGMKNVGEDLTKYITLPLAGAATAIYKFGSDFETELSKVVGLVGVSQSQVDEWADDILELGPKLGKSPKELAEALFFVTSAGIKGAEALEVLEMAGKASAAGLGETKTIADLVTSAMNAYGVENLSAAQATDIVTAAVREGKAEASELASSMGQVLPLASQMGVSFDQVAAAQAAMTRTGTNASEAATQLKSIMAGLIKPSKQAEEQLKAMGTSSQEMRKKIKDEGLINSLFDLKEMTNKYGEEAMARVFPNIRALMGVLDLMGSSAEDNAVIFDKVANSTGALDDAFSAASDTMDFKWNQAMSQIQATAISFFDILKANLIPVLDVVIDVLGFIGDKFAALDPQIQQVSLVFAAMAAAVGPILVVLGGGIAAFGAVIGGIGAIVTGIGGVITTIGIPALLALGAGFVTLGVWIGAIIAVIAGWVAAFIHLWKTNDEFRENVLNTWESIKENAITIFNDIKSAVSHVWGIIKTIWKNHGEEIKNTAKYVWDTILNLIKLGMEQIKNVIKLVTSVIKGDWSGAWDAIKSIVKTGKDFALNVFDLLSTGVKKAMSNMKSVAIDIIKGMISRLKEQINLLVNIGKAFGKNIIDGIKSSDYYKAGKNIIQSVIDGIKSMFSSLSSAASSMAQTIRNFLPFSPAKEGPLKDLNHLDFATSILQGLDKAQDKIREHFLGDLILNGVDSRTVDVKSSALSNPNISGIFNFNGIQDVIEFMQEMRATVRRVGGRTNA